MTIALGTWVAYSRYNLYGVQGAHLHTVGRLLAIEDGIATLWITPERNDHVEYKRLRPLWDTVEWRDLISNAGATE